MSESDKTQVETPLRLEIDKYRLDEEWVKHPQQVYNWAKKVADAQLALDEAKSALNLAYAELDKEVRDNPAEYGIEKITNPVIEQTVIANPIHIAAQKRVNRAKYNLDIAGAAVTALEHRKRALTLLVELQIREFFSDANAKPRARSDEAEEFEKEAIRSRGRRRTDRDELVSEDAERE